MSFDKLVLRECLTFNDTQLAAAAQVTSSFATIFNSWYRFSHNSSGNFPAASSELNGWSYNADTDVINCTINSTTYIGFVSAEKYEYYRHEALLGSVNSDDDTLSVILAFAIDANGKEHTLSFLRSAGGMVPRCAIVYNYGQSDQIILTRDDSATVFTNTSGGNGWSSKKCKVLCVRDGSDFAVASTQIGDASGSYVLTLSASLSDNAVLSIFTGPQSFGYGAFSQTSASYSAIKFTPVIGSIYDLLNTKVWSLDINSGSFVEDSGKSLSDLSKGRLIYAPNLSQLYYISPSGTFELIGSSTTNPYDIQGSYAGNPAANTVVLRTVVGRQFSLQANFYRCVALCDTAPSAAVTFTITRNDNSLGKITFASGSIVGVFSSSSAVTLSVGDVLLIKGPSVANAAITNLMFCLYGTLN